MSARILIVDDLAPNRRLLETKLAREYYDTVSASDGRTALDLALQGGIDLILMDAMMPGMDGFETCERLKANPSTWHIPVIMVTALEETADRIRGLEAGADDFITKPIEDFNLMARVRSMLRLKMTTDQLLSHAGVGTTHLRPVFDRITRRSGNVLLVDDNVFFQSNIRRHLTPAHNVLIEDDPKAALKSAKGGVDLIIISLEAANFDGLRLCASLRFDVATKDIPILVIGDASNESKLVRAYDLGINDTLLRPIEPQELIARVGTQLKRKFYADSLREDFNQNLEMVVTDPLTGLGNRRHFERAIEPMFDALNTHGDAFSILIMDIDHFKRVNDILGHDTGDSILKDVAARLASNLRAVDILARYGGEEFMVAMPGALEEDARIAAERLRATIGTTPMALDGQVFSVTVSAGVAQVLPGEKLRDVFKRADGALYAAKHAGRDRVKVAA